MDDPKKIEVPAEPKAAEDVPAPEPTVEDPLEEPVEDKEG